MEKKKSFIPIVAGIIFALDIISPLMDVIRCISEYGLLGPVAFLSPYSIVFIAIYTVIAVSLFTKQRNLGLPICFLVLAIIDIKAISTNMNVINAMFIIQMTLFFLSDIALTLLCLGEFTNFVKKFYKKEFTKFFFVPAGIHLLSTIIGFGISGILETIGYFLVGLWVAYPNGISKNVYKVVINDNTNIDFNTENVVNEGVEIKATGEMYCDLVKHILLLLFTFGIWYYMWIYKMTKYTNNIKDEEYRDPTKKLLLCMFVPFYLIYWIYKTAQRIDKMAKEKYVESDLSTMCLILAIFVGIIPPILMQEKVNAIVTAKPKRAAETAPYQEQKNANLDTADELKKYKELLDGGVITQEEFEAKKKQLLGL